MIEEYFATAPSDDGWNPPTPHRSRCNCYQPFASIRRSLSAMVAGVA
jgi:hypothetical protein